jgi:hypothetical protein
MGANSGRVETEQEMGHLRWNAGIGSYENDGDRKQPEFSMGVERALGEQWDIRAPAWFAVGLLAIWPAFDAARRLVSFFRRRLVANRGIQFQRST